MPAALAVHAEIILVLGCGVSDTMFTCMVEFLDLKFYFVLLFVVVVMWLLVHALISHHGGTEDCKLLGIKICPCTRINPCMGH